MKVSCWTPLPFLGPRSKGFTGSLKVLQTMRKVNPEGVWNLASEKQIVLFPFSFQIYVFKIYCYVAFLLTSAKMSKTANNFHFLCRLDFIIHFSPIYQNLYLGSCIFMQILPQFSFWSSLTIVPLLQLSRKSFLLTVTCCSVY